MSEGGGGILPFVVYSGSLTGDVLGIRHSHILHYIGHLKNEHIEPSSERVVLLLSRIRIN